MRVSRPARHRLAAMITAVSLPALPATGLLSAGPAAPAPAASSPASGAALFLLTGARAVITGSPGQPLSTAIAPAPGASPLAKSFIGMRVAGNTLLVPAVALRPVK